MGKSRTKITNALRLLKLDPRVQELLITGKLSEGHGKILAGIPTQQQFALAELCIQKNWSVRKIEIEAKKLLQPANNEGPYSDPNIKHLESALSEHVGNRVAINCEDRGGGSILNSF